MPMHQLKAHGQAPEEVPEICLFAQTHYRNQLRRFGIKLDDRRRHMYIIGKTGMGKSTMMENMMLHDIYRGHGVGLVDPHGDFAEKMINFIPSHRINDVVYFNPADTDHPIGFNILETQNDEQKHLVAAGLMGTFKKIWPDVWSARMEYILNNTLLALLDYPGSTLLGINRLLSDKKYRKRVVSKVKDPVIKAFWQTEFASYSERYAQEAVASIQNKIGQFLSASVIRNMVAQVTSTVDIRQIMDSNKILIMNLSKGRIGEDNSRLLGGMLITKIQLSAMERVDTPEKERKDFFLYVDEFQNFATPSFASILSEARKYRLSLIMAHQYVKQLDEVVADAVFGNVGTIVTFRIGGLDAEMLSKEFMPTFTEEDVVNLSKYHVFLKLMIDGVASLPFSAITMPPVAAKTDSSEKVIRVSRERYSRPREVVESKIARWSGIDGASGGDEEGDDGDDDENDDSVDTSQNKKLSGSIVPARDKPFDAAQGKKEKPRQDAPKKIEPAPRPKETTQLPKEKKQQAPQQSPREKTDTQKEPVVPTAPAVSLQALDSRAHVVKEEKTRTQASVRSDETPAVQKETAHAPEPLAPLNMWPYMQEDVSSSAMPIQEKNEQIQENPMAFPAQEKPTAPSVSSYPSSMPQEQSGKKKKRKRKRNRNRHGGQGSENAVSQAPASSFQEQSPRHVPEQTVASQESVKPAPQPPLPPPLQVKQEENRVLPPNTPIQFD